MRDLADALEMLDKDGHTRAVVLATAGKVFCSGADLSNRTSEGPIPERSINPLYDQAVRLFNVRKERALANAIFRYLATAATTAGDARASELSQKNAACGC
jgi:enoyl-CoA hydratase/carnithine racemase